MNKRTYRRETKWVISRRDFARIQPKLDVLMRRDVFSGRDGYTVRSLYFDTPFDRDLFDVLDGLMNKQKIRLRVYSGRFSEVWLESKIKQNTDVEKQALRVSREEAERLIAGDAGFLLDHPDPLAAFLYTRLRLSMYRPKSIVEYRRIAYEYPVGNTRITFDTFVSGIYGSSRFFEPVLGGSPLMETDLGVLEVKTDAGLPGILAEAVRTADGLSEANSKYAQSRLMF